MGNNLLTGTDGVSLAETTQWLTNLWRGSVLQLSPDKYEASRQQCGTGTIFWYHPTLWTHTVTSLCSQSPHEGTGGSCLVSSSEAGLCWNGLTSFQSMTSLTWPSRNNCQIHVPDLNNLFKLPVCLLSPFCMWNFVRTGYLPSDCFWVWPLCTFCISVIYKLSPIYFEEVLLCNISRGVSMYING